MREYKAPKPQENKKRTPQEGKRRDDKRPDKPPEQGGLAPAT